MGTNRRRIHQFSNNHTHFSENRYMPYHPKLQRKLDRFDSKCLHFYDHDTEQSIEIGLNKEYIYIDDSDRIDGLKDGN